MDFRIEEKFERFINLVDIDSFIDYTLFMSYIGINYWSLWSNFQMWASRGISEKPYEDKKIRFMLYDTDNSLSISTPQVGTNIFESDRGTITLLKALMRNDYFKQYFSQKADSFIEKMSEEKIIDTVNSIYEARVDFVNEDCYRHLGSGHNSAIYDKIISFLSNRHVYYAAHINSLIN